MGFQWHPKKPRKVRSDSKLLRLTEGQREQLAGWLIDGMAYTEARRRILAEFGLDLGSLNPLTRFWEKVCEPLLLEKSRRNAQS